MKHQSLDAWLAWLERAHPSEIDLGLDRIGQVLKRLSLTFAPQIITVAGTNGKGSCVACASALLKAQGYSVGSYTSPHLRHYCERVAINGQPVSEAAMCEAFAAIDAAREEISLTYFEFGTLAAFWLFDRNRVDICVLEVGLGGRLDAVNVLDADVAVITSIDIDHQDWLGSDRETIGWEKAGIMRPARPVVCADPSPPQSIIQHAQKLGAELVQIEQDFSIKTERGTVFYASGGVQVPLANVHLPLPSVAAAIKAVSLLAGPPDVEIVRDVVAQTHLPGRRQWLPVGEHSVLLDVAHNPAATELLARCIRAHAGARVHYVFAVMADKDIDAILNHLQGERGPWYLAQLQNVSRAASPRMLADKLVARGWQVAAIAPVADCLRQALDAAAQGDLVVVFGSFFTVSEALATLQCTNAGE